MIARILQGDVFDLLPTIKPGSVNAVVTSPPYWMLRSYLPKGHPLKHLELGSEPSPAKYVENQVRVLRLVRDALADHGTVWLNVGDTYTHAPGKRKPTDAYGAKQLTNGYAGTTASASADGIDAGNLCLIPQRLAIALQDDGWIVRSVIVWHKPAPMPSSVSGWRWERCRKKLRGQSRQTHVADIKAGHRRESGIGPDFRAEWTDCPGCKKCNPHGGYVLRRGSWRPTSAWEPVIMLAKAPAYFCDAIAVQQPAASATVDRNEYTRVIDDPDEQYAVRHDHETVLTTANPRDVWTIAAEPLRAKHYAAYPSELVRRCLQAATSAKGYCPACGLPWVRVVESKSVPDRPGRIQGRDGDTIGEAHGEDGRDGSRCSSEYTTLDWRPSCACLPVEPRPGLVLDPFAGSGRTALAARRLGLDFIGCELNPDYADMARGILRDDAPLFSSLSEPSE